MSSTKPEFRLSEDVDGVLRELCKAYGMDGSLLSWQFDKHVSSDGETPFRLNTNDFTRQIELKDGVDKIVVEIEYATANPNHIKWIRFHEMPSKKRYIITQTSMKHIHEDSTCALWLELPQGAHKEDISAVKSLLNVELCCEDWKDHLCASVETTLERTFRVIAEEDVEWVKKQVIHKDQVTERLISSLAFKEMEVTALKDEVDSLKGKLDEKNAFMDKIDSLQQQLAEQDAVIEELQQPESPTPSKKRKARTPKGRTPRTPMTAPARSQGIDGDVTTPTRNGRRPRNLFSVPT